MLDRTTAPPIRNIRQIHLPTPVRYQLDNGIEVYETDLGTQEVVRLEIVFNAGRPYEKVQLAARTTANLLKEGTRQYSAATIAEQIDFYGGTLSVPIHLDTSNIILYSLTKHFAKLLPLLADMLRSPVFPQTELDALKQRNIQRLQVDLTKNDVVAYRQVTEHIFSRQHPYGYNSLPESYERLQREDLLQHFDTNYVANNCTLFLSGKLHPEFRKLLNMFFGQLKTGPVRLNNMSLPIDTPASVSYHLPGSVQTAIRIGCRMFNRKHEDYRGMYVLNTILGGYFGSRLMHNIREEKGYTYNIYSTLDTMTYDGYFYIGTEVGNEVAKPAMKEIYHEFELLKQELVKEDELTMVKNYLLGNLLTMVDGAFNVSEVIKTQVLEGLPTDYLAQLVQYIQNVEATTLQQLAQRYLKREQMWEVVVD
ncbi:MAG: pitrilysin family protein [Bacteroidota bacterium]